MNSCLVKINYLCNALRRIIIANVFKISALHRILLFLTLLSSAWMFGFSQFQPTKVEISSNTTTIGNVAYYLHEVLPGHTLYSIAKAYGVSQEKILSENPPLSKEGLRSGLVIRIVKIEKPTENDIAIPVQDTFSVKHQVKTKESWFSISRLYGVNVADLKNANPGLKWGLPAGITIRIPGDLIQNKEILNMAPALTIEERHAKPDSLAVIKTTAELQTEVVHQLTGSKTYKIGILLPLNVAENAALPLTDSTEYDFRFWEFLQGVYLAADSLKAAGFNLDLHVFDTEKRADRVTELVRNGSLNGLDMIIGPVYPNALEVASNFARSKGIPLISPFSTRTSFLENNPWIFQVNTPEDQQNQSTAEYLGTDRSYNLVLIAPDNDKGKAQLRNFIDEVNRYYSRSFYGNRPTVLYYQPGSKTFIDLDSLPASLFRALDTKARNRVVITSEDQVFVTEMINRLKQMPATYDITLFGKPKWTEFSNIDMQYLFDLGFQYAANFTNAFIDYNDPYVTDFCRKFLNHWNVDPGRFAFLGFDVTWYFVEALEQISRQAFRSRNEINLETGYIPLMTDFEFHRTGSGDGFLNHAVPIVWYRKETLTRERLNTTNRDD